MISDRDRRILSETEWQLRMEDPGLSRRFEAATRTGTLCRLRTGLARAATSLVIIIPLLLLVGSMALGMTIALYGLIPLPDPDRRRLPGCRRLR